jgi:hypothetical protein
MSRVRAVFYLPLRDNDGRPLIAEIDDLEADLYVRFVGWTFLGYVKGVYQMADRSRALDESASYAVVTDEDRIQTEKDIRELLRTETQAISLGEKLFSPTGLFGHLASTEDERRELVRSALFKEAQKRFRELQYQEAVAFTENVKGITSAPPAKEYLVKVQKAETK